jgi:hypothetical protein
MATSLRLRCLALCSRGILSASSPAAAYVAHARHSQQIGMFAHQLRGIAHGACIKSDGSAVRASAGSALSRASAFGLRVARIFANIRVCAMRLWLRWLYNFTAARAGMVFSKYKHLAARSVARHRYAL